LLFAAVVDMVVTDVVRDTSPMICELRMPSCNVCLLLSRWDHLRVCVCVCGRLGAQRLGTEGETKKEFCGER
jgi:hypothetical protein